MKFTATYTCAGGKRTVYGPIPFEGPLPQAFTAWLEQGEFAHFAAALKGGVLRLDILGPDKLELANVGTGRALMTVQAEEE